MATFSDDEAMFAVDSILQQRKRKGVLEYLVKWKETGDEGVTWEPAANISKDCAVAVELFQQSQKSKRSSSRSRKSSKSRSRSRSSSRTRKPRQSSRQKTTRSRSKGRTEESPEKKLDSTKAEGESSQEKASSVTVVQSEQVKQQATTADKKEVTISSSSSSTASTRVLRSSAMGEKGSLEVQRVRNEQRPVREDDSKPRSAFWKVADYAVIILFIISAVAAFVLFLEKFLDLGDFKKQFYPNLTVLQGRLDHVKERIVELGSEGFDKVSDLWLQIVEQIKGTQTDTGSASPK